MFALPAFLNVLAVDLLRFSSFRNFCGVSLVLFLFFCFSLSWTFKSCTTLFSLFFLIYPLFCMSCLRLHSYYPIRLLSPNSFLAAVHFTVCSYTPSSQSLINFSCQFLTPWKMLRNMLRLLSRNIPTTQPLTFPSTSDNFSLDLRGVLCSRHHGCPGTFSLHCQGECYDDILPYSAILN